LNCEREYTRFKVGELRNKLADRGLPKTGTKQDLITRLQEDDLAKDNAAGIWTLNVKDMFKFTTLKINKNATGSQFKQQLSIKRCVPVEKLIVSHKVDGKAVQLQDDTSLEAQGIDDGYFLDLRIKL
jgi:hypothetical protein